MKTNSSAAGFTKTPRLDKRISQARARFRKNQVISWKKLKDNKTAKGGKPDA